MCLYVWETDRQMTDREVLYKCTVVHMCCPVSLFYFLSNLCQVVSLEGGCFLNKDGMVVHEWWAQSVLTHWHLSAAFLWMGGFWEAPSWQKQFENCLIKVSNHSARIEVCMEADHGNRWVWGRSLGVLWNLVWIHTHFIRVWVPISSVDELRSDKL